MIAVIVLRATLASVVLVGFGGQAAFWYVVAGLCLALGTAVGIAIRKWVQHLARKARKGYIEWHAEAVETHVEPKFAALRSEIEQTAETLSAQTISTANEVRSEAIENARIVRQELTEYQSALSKHELNETEHLDALSKRITPLVQTVEMHVISDSKSFDEQREGQTRQDEMLEAQGATLARIEQAIENGNGRSSDI